MATRLFGVLTDGLNKPIINATVMLVAKGNTLNVLTGSEAIFRTNAQGAYSIVVNTGHYIVIVGPVGVEPYKAGEIVIYGDSPDGSLNGYLIDWAPEELTPDIVLQIREQVALAEAASLSAIAASAEAKKSKDASAASATAAANSASAAKTSQTASETAATQAKQAQSGASGSANTASQALTTVQQLKTDTQALKDSATTSASVASDKAGIATAQAAIAKTEADRAKTEADKTANKVSKSGDKMTGPLVIETNGAALQLQPSEPGKGTYVTWGDAGQPIKGYMGKGSNITDSVTLYNSIASGGFSLPQALNLPVEITGYTSLTINGKRVYQAGDVIPVTDGGTGANNQTSARMNLSLDRFLQASSSTVMQAPPGAGGLSYGLSLSNTGEWGVTEKSTPGWITLGIAMGGTGASTVSAARTNLFAMANGKQTSIPGAGSLNTLFGVLKAQGSMVARNDGVATIGTLLVRYGSGIYCNLNDTHTLILPQPDTGILAVACTTDPWLAAGTAPAQNVLYGTANTTRAADGTLKAASPIVKIFADGTAETNRESEGVTVERVTMGQYLIAGVLGMNSDATWGGIDGGFDIPTDRNKQPLIWIDYKINEDGSILVKTYHRTYPNAPAFARNVIDGVAEGSPIDIPADQFVSVRVEMPSDSIYNLKIKADAEERKKAEEEEKQKQEELEQALKDTPVTLPNFDLP